LNEEDPMGGAPPNGAGPGGPPPPMPGGAPPMGGPPMGGDPMGGGMGGPPMGGPGGGGAPLTQPQLTKMKSVSAWDAIEEVLEGGDKKGGKKDKGMVKQPAAGPKHLMQ
jgi:hypothetical protein